MEPSRGSMTKVFRTGKEPDCMYTQIDNFGKWSEWNTKVVQLRLKLQSQGKMEQARGILDPIDWVENCNQDIKRVTRLTSEGWLSFEYTVATLKHFGEFSVETS